MKRAQTNPNTVKLSRVASKFTTSPPPPHLKPQRQDAANTQTPGGMNHQFLLKRIDSNLKPDRPSRHTIPPLLSSNNPTPTGTPPTPRRNHLHLPRNVRRRTKLQRQCKCLLAQRARPENGAFRAGERVRASAHPTRGYQRQGPG